MKTYNGSLFLFMIWLVMAYSLAAVELFEQDNAHKLMRESHFGETEFIVGAFKHFFTQTEGAAYNKSKVTDTS